MWTTILTLLTPIVLWLIKNFVLDQAKKSEYIKSYYDFLDAVDKSGQTKVDNHLTARDALEAEQKRLEEEKLKRDGL